MSPKMRTPRSRGVARAARCHSRSNRTWSSTRAAEGDPVVDPVRVPRPERARPRRARRARRGCGEQRRRARERRRRHVRRAGDPLGRPERQDLPPALSRRGEPVDEAKACSSSTPFGNEVGWRRIPDARSSSMRLGQTFPRESHADAPSPERDTHVSRSRRSSRSSTAAATPSSATVGDQVDVYATVFKDGHDTLGGRGARARPRRAAVRARCRCCRSATTATAGAFTVDRPGRWQFAVSAWTDRIATWQDELRRKVDAGQADLAGELAEGAVLLGRESLTVEEGLAADAGDRHGVATSQAFEVDVDRELARFGAWYELFPRSFGGLPRRREGAAAARRARLRRRLPAADPPDRPHEPEGQEQHARARARATSARRGRSARRKAATTRSTPTSARGRTSTRWSRRRAAAGIEIALDFAIQCSPDHPWLKEHPGVVQPPPGRDAQVRGEPAQALPGHLQRQLRVRGLARALAGAARRRPRLGRARHHGVPRRQPAHEAGRVLGVADPRGARRRIPR